VPAATSTAVDIEDGLRSTLFDPASQGTMSLAATCQPIASTWKTLDLCMLVETLTALDI